MIGKILSVCLALMGICFGIYIAICIFTLEIPAGTDIISITLGSIATIMLVSLSIYGSYLLWKYDEDLRGII